MMNKFTLILLSLLFATVSATASAEGIWTGVQGNAAHTGYVKVNSDPANFHTLWSRQIYLNDKAPEHMVMQGSALIATAKMAYVDISHAYYVRARDKYTREGERWLFALNPQTGEEVWKLLRDPTDGYSSIAYDNDKILSYGSLSGNSGLDVINPDTGSVELTVPVSASGYQTDGLLADQGKAYLTFTETIPSLYKHYSLDTKTGKIDWVLPLNENFESYEAPVVTPKYVVYAEQRGISVYDKKTGRFEFEIKNSVFYQTPGPTYLNGTPVYDAVNDVVYESYRYAPNGQRVVVAFDLTKKNIKWISEKNTGWGFPVLAGNEIFITGYNNQGKFVNMLQSMDTATGKINWTWTSEEEGLFWFSFPVATDDLVFINSIHKIYAISRKTHQKVWEFDGQGKIAIGNHILFILQETTRPIPNSTMVLRNGLRVTAIGF